MTQVQLYSDARVFIEFDFNHSVINSNTLPVLVFLTDFFPVSPLFIQVKLNPDDGRFEVIGNQFVLDSNRNFGYFKLRSNETQGRQTRTNEVKIQFNMLGSYLDGFEIENQIEFNPVYIKKNSTVKGSVGWTKGQLRLALNDSATVFWAFGPKEGFLTKNLSSFDWILEKTYPLFDPPTDTQNTLRQQEDNINSFLSLIEIQEWIQFQKKRKDLISTFLFHDQVFLKSGTHVLFEPSETIPSLEYLALVWLKDDSDHLIQLTWSGRTDEFLDHCHLIITSRGSLRNMTSHLSLAFLVLQERIFFLNETTKDNLTYISEYLLVSDYSLKAAPCKAVNDAKKSGLQKYFDDIQILGFKYKNLSQEELGVPGFVDTYSLIDSNILEIRSFSEIHSFVCCLAEHEPDPNSTLTIRDIQYLRDQMIDVVSFAECYEDLYQNFTLSFPLSRFKTAGDYLITCIMCNQYPMNPLCTDSNSSYYYELSVSDLTDNDFSIGLWLSWGLALVL